MNAIDLLKEDHRVVDALFQKAEATTPSEYPPIVTKILNELETHAHVEETIFYPKLRREGNKELVDIVLEGIEEHGQIKKFLRELGALKASNKRFEPKLKVLIEDTRHHVKEEEGEMFDLVKDQFSDSVLEKLGREMEKEKVRFQKANSIPPRSQQDAEAGKGMLASIVDAVAGFLTVDDGGGTSKGSPKSKSASSASKGASGSKATGSKGASSPKASAGGASSKASTSKSGASASKSAGSAKSSPSSASSTKSSGSKAGSNGKSAGGNANSKGGSSKASTSKSAVSGSTAKKSASRSSSGKGTSK